MQDPEFLSEAAQARLEVEPSTGEELTALIERTVSTPPAVVSRVRRALEPETTR